MVTGALAGPSAMSGSETGFATSDALCAIASAIRRSGEKPARAASPVSDRAMVKAGRGMINGLLPYWRVHARRPTEGVFASWKRQLGQWPTAIVRATRLNFALPRHR